MGAVVALEAGDVVGVPAVEDGLPGIPQAQPEVTATRERMGHGGDADAEDAKPQEETHCGARPQSLEEAGHELGSRTIRDGVRPGLAYRRFASAGDIDRSIERMFWELLDLAVVVRRREASHAFDLPDPSSGLRADALSFASQFHLARFARTTHAPALGHLSAGGPTNL